MAEVSTLDEDEALTYVNDPRWLLAERILATRDFQRSPRLSDFLRHICQLTLEGREDIISEQYLGEALFGRAPGYDAAADTIVRSHALRLRRRLEHYFQREGKSEPLILVIPRGRYVPLFLPAAEEIASDIQEPVPLSSLESGTYDVPDQLSNNAASLPTEGISGSLPPATEPRTDLHAVLRRYRTVIAFTLCFVLALLGIVIYQWHALRAYRALEYRDRNHPLWSRLFNAQEPTRIVLGDSGLVLFHATARLYVSLHDYVNNDLSKELP